MAGHIQDRWYKTEPTPTASPPRQNRPPRHRPALPRPLHRPRRHREVQELPRRAEAPGRAVADARSKPTWRAASTSTPAPAGHLPAVRREVGRPRHTTEQQPRGSGARCGCTPYPYIGTVRSARSRPSHIRDWLGELETRVPPPPTGGSSSAPSRPCSPRPWTTDSRQNPCQRQVGQGAPSRTQTRVTSLDCRAGVRRAGGPSRALPGDGRRGRRMRAASGRGLRPAGRRSGLRRRVVHVGTRSSASVGSLVFAPPKGGKVRDVPLPPPWRGLRHIRKHPPVKVTLPWRTPDGPP